MLYFLCISLLFMKNEELTVYPDWSLCTLTVFPTLWNSAHKLFLSFTNISFTNICVRKLFFSGTGNLSPISAWPYFPKDLEFLFPSPSFLDVLLTSHFQPAPQLVKNVSCRSFLQGAFPCCIKKFSSEHCRTLLDSLCPIVFCSQQIISIINNLHYYQIVALDHLPTCPQVVTTFDLLITESQNDRGWKGPLWII